MEQRSRPLVALAAALTLTVGLLGASGTAAAAPDSPSSTTSVAGLRTNSEVNPLGIDQSTPRLSWQLLSDRRGVTQQAYQIRVASSADALGDPDVWDSGRVDSRDSIEVPYAGPELDSRAGYVWSVRVWDDRGDGSEWSEPATFETAMLDTDEWTADWIGLDRPQLGAEWTDYAVEFTASGISGALGVYFRGQDTEHAYMWQLSEDAHALRPHIKAGAYQVLEPVPFPADFDFAAEHRYRIEAEGDTIRTFVDGELLDERQDSTYSGPGSAGFRTNGAEAGLVHEAAITSADGQQLAQTDFPAGDRTFNAGTVTGDGLLVDSAGGEAWLRRDDPVPLLRKEFELEDKEVERARIYSTARGVYRMQLNGERVGDHEFAPGWTDYRARIDYQTYDVTDLLREGENALGAELASGWYTGKVAMFGSGVYGSETSLIAQLRIDYADGTSATVVTDDSWQATDGPIREADILDGESYDQARAGELGDWAVAGYPADGWQRAQQREETAETLEPQTATPVRVTEELTRTERIDSPTEGAYLYDLGQNMVGYPRITLEGRKGETVRIRHGEVLDQEGALYTANLRAAKATNYYTFSEDGPVTYQPSFTFHGFRYIEITGTDAPPAGEDVVGVVVGTDGELTSELATSSPMVNQLWSNIVWGMRGNFLSVPTDTPARDERMGWTGDINVFARTAVYDMDSQTFLVKWLEDLRDTQRADGALPGVAPIVPGRFDGGYGSAGWMDAGVNVPWTLWQAYGDTEVIRENYEMMTRYVEYLDADSTDHIRETGGYLDWLNLDDPTPADVLDTAFVAKSVRQLAEMAAVIGEDADAAKYEQRYEDIRSAYQAAFIAEDGTVKGDSQTSYVLTLMNDLEPDHLREQVIEQFTETLERRDWHLSTGFLGVDGLLPALTKAGRTDIAYRLLLNESYPSWGYEIGWGATTIWERWNSINPDGSFNDVGMNSFNHYAYGAVGEWMYRTMAGVSAGEPGYREVLVAPEPGDGIDHSSFTLDTRYGTVRSDWEKTSGGLDLAVEIPANTTGEVRVPAYSEHAVTEGGLPAADAEGVRFVEYADGAAVYEVGSGSYDFAIDRALGELGEAAADTSALAEQIGALSGRGLIPALAKRHLTKEAATLGKQIDQARTARAGADRDRAAARTHEALATGTALGLWVDLQRVLRLLDRPTADALKETLAEIDGHLSAASGVLVGAVARAVPEDGPLLAGDSVAVEVTLENTGTRQLNGVSSKLSSPAGWTVRASGTRPSSVKAGQSVVHRYEVLVPKGAGVGTEALSGSVSYRQSWGTATLPVAADVVVSPTVTVDSATVEAGPLDPGEAATAEVVLRNHSGREAAGQIRVAGPTGFEEPEPLPFTVPANGTTTAEVPFTVPLTVIEGELPLTFATGTTAAERSTANAQAVVDVPPAGPTDHVDLGDAASEDVHGLTASQHSGTNTEAGLTRRYTHSSHPGGWFEFDLAVPAGEPFVLRAVETYDAARRKSYDILIDGEVVHSHTARRTESGEGTQSYQVLVDRPDLTAEGTVRVRFHHTGSGYDPSIADVWSVPLPGSP